MPDHHSDDTWDWGAAGSPDAETRQPTHEPGGAPLDNPFEVLGAVSTGLGTYFAAKETAKASKKEAERNRIFQELMSSTAVQRHAADLQAAGFNRILGVTGGQTASQPSGAVAGVPDYSQSIRDATTGASAVAGRALQRAQKTVQVQTEKKLKQETTESLARTNESVARGTAQNYKNKELQRAHLFWSDAKSQKWKDAEIMGTSARAVTQNLPGIGSFRPFTSKSKLLGKTTQTFKGKTHGTRSEKYHYSK